MWSVFLQLWEALGGPLGVLVAVLVLSGVIWVCWWALQRADQRRKEDWARIDERLEARDKRADRDRADSKAEVERIRAESKEQADRDREAFKAELERIRADSKEQADRDREAFKAELDRVHAESKERDDRDRAAHEKRADRDSEQNARDTARLASAIAALQGDVKDLQRDVKGLHGDVKVLLDRSNRSSGDEVGGGQSGHPYGVAHQATPDQCEDDAKSSSDEPVAQPPADSAAEDPAD